MPHVKSKALEVCHGVNTDLHEPSSLPLRSGASSVLATLSDANFSETNFYLSEIPNIVKQHAFDLSSVLLPLFGIWVLILVLSCRFNRAARLKQQHVSASQIYIYACLSAVFFAYLLFSDVGKLGALVGDAANTGLCSAGLAIHDTLHGDTAKNAHGFPGMLHLKNLTSATLIAATSRLGNMTEEEISALQDEMQSFYKYLVDDSDVWDKIGAISVRNPYDPSRASQTLADLGVVNSSKEQMNASIHHVLNVVADRVSSANSEVVSWGKNLSTQLDWISKAVRFLTPLQQRLVEVKQSVDIKVSSHSHAVVLAVGLLLILMWSLVGCCLKQLQCCYARFPTVGNGCARLCMKYCFGMSHLALTVLVCVVLASSLLGVTCGLLSGSEVANTVSTVSHWRSHWRENQGDPLGDAVFEHVYSTVAGTCLAGRNDGSLANAFLGPHRDWTALFTCMTQLPHACLQHRTDENHWTYTGFNKTITCLHQSSFVNGLLQEHENVSPASFHAYLTQHNSSAAASESFVDFVQAGISKAVDVREWAVSMADQAISQYVESICTQIVETHPLISHEMCIEQFHETKLDVLRNVSSIAADLISTESLEPVLQNLTKELPGKMQAIVTSVGTIFSFLDGNLLSMMNCGLVAKAWENIVDGSVCSSSGLGGAIVALLSAIVAIIFSCLTAALLFCLGSNYEKTEEPLVEARALYNMVDVDNEPLLKN